jgi:hypothetical protein
LPTAFMLEYQKSGGRQTPNRVLLPRRSTGSFGADFVVNAGSFGANLVANTGSFVTYFVVNTGRALPYVRAGWRVPNARFLVPQYEGVWHTPSRLRPSNLTPCTFNKLICMQIEGSALLQTTFS